MDLRGAQRRIDAHAPSPEMTTRAEHQQFCQESRQLYLEGRNARSDGDDWREALWIARRKMIALFRASDFLLDIPKALRTSAGHTTALRHLLAPPISQDQFKLLCPQWSKELENKCRPMTANNAEAVGLVFNQRRSRRLTSWLTYNRPARLDEVVTAIDATTPLIASQVVATARRSRLSREQEDAAIGVLEERNWVKVMSSTVSTGGQLPARNYMHKTRFASGPNENQEVDIACGLGGTVVLAMECKVTNDTTNSVKRINDVLKKAGAWRGHWGTFVRPAALLQGVISFTDVERLLDYPVEVFWAHKIDLFAEWIEANTSA